jgi:RimJ/RimL family protein N-acetyltransferase
VNSLGQPIGDPVAPWQPPPRPSRESTAGRYSRLEPLDAERHAADLHRANAEDASNRLWTYLPYGPFDSLSAYLAWLRPVCDGADPLFFAVVDLAHGRALGIASYLRIEPANGCIEVGHIAYAPALQRTRAATEAMFLMMQRVFELGYRRYEWKCDALNAPSRAAALRLGFSFEGVFRQAAIYKGRNRDTAWYSVIDAEWPPLRDAFMEWLEPANFDTAGRQRAKLAQLQAAKRLGHLNTSEQGR